MEGSSLGVPLFDLTPQLEAGRLIRADSLTELAKALDMDPARLDETVATYNRAVDGEIADPFGRDGLCHHSGALIRLERPPFYAYPSVSVVLATYCGLTVAADAAVQDVFGAPIAGLYAAGEITGGFHGAAYMTGSSLGKAALFGRLAGRNAASRMPS
jgi:fumarate reductase flavoprotein subunit